jgi:hypothetical protein
MEMVEFILTKVLGETPWERIKFFVKQVKKHFQYRYLLYVIQNKNYICNSSILRPFDKNIL